MKLKILRETKVTSDVSSKKTMSQVLSAMSSSPAVTTTSSYNTTKDTFSDEEEEKYLNTEFTAEKKKSKLAKLFSYKKGKK